MCLILLAHQVLPDLPLLVLANRDEFIDRIVEPLQVWNNHHGESNNNNNNEDLVAGIDRWKGNENGTYLAMHRKSGRFAAVVHVRQLGPPPSPPPSHGGGDNKNGHTTNAGGSSSTGAAAGGGSGSSTTTSTPGHSRGRLVVDFCTNDNEPVATYHENVLTPLDKNYDPYGMIYGTVEHGFYYYTNCGESNTETIMKSTKLQPGIIYGLSNGALDAAWPKVRRGKELLRQTLDHWEQQRQQEQQQQQQQQQTEDQQEEQPQQRESQDGGISDDDLFAILKDDWRPPEDDDNDDNNAAAAGDANNDCRLPDTGVGKITERFLSSIFIPSYFYDYGTIASTVVRVHNDGNVRIVERTYRHDDESEYTYVAEQSFRL